MEYVQRWLDIIRQDTENQTVPDSAGNEQEGIRNDQLLRWLNEAQNDIQRAIQSVNPGMFTDRLVQAVSGSAYQTLPFYTMLDGRVLKCEYGKSNTDSDYYKLSLEIIQQALEGFSSSGGNYSPRYYTNEGRRIRLEPVPTSGYLRLTHKKRVPDLNVRQGTIASNVKNVAETELQSITLATDGFLDETVISNNQYLCICDAEGNQTATNVYYTSYESSTRTISIDNHSLATDTIANGDYITIGQYASTHCQLPYECKDYLISWANVKALAHDDNFEQAEAEKAVRNGFRQTILEAYSSESADCELLPVTHPEWFC